VIQQRLFHGLITTGREETTSKTKEEMKKAYSNVRGRSHSFAHANFDTPRSFTLSAQLDNPIRQPAEGENEQKQKKPKKSLYTLSRLESSARTKQCTGRYEDEAIGEEWWDQNSSREQKNLHFFGSLESKILLIREGCALLSFCQG
jgi:hypothetical protein